MVTTEPNELRRAHRVPIQMWVEIAGTTYSTKDWSLTGFGALDFNGTMQLDDRVEVGCILPMREAAMRVTTVARYRGKRGEVSGFEFEDLSPQKRRILRHYIEMAIEGRLDNAEDLVSTASMPGINSPFEQALPLVDSENKAQREFTMKSIVMLAAGVALMLVIGGTIFYNRVFRLEAVGLISGTVEQVTANSEGVLGPVAFQEGVFLDKGTKLFQIEDAQLKAELDTIDSQIKQYKEQADLAKKVADTPDPALAAAPPIPDGNLMGSLRETYDEALLEMENARELFEQRIITNKDFSIAKNNYLRARISLLREEAQGTQPAPVAPRFNTQEFKQLRDLDLQIGQLEARKKGLQERLGKNEVLAPVRGKILNIAHSSGEYVRRNDVILLMEKDATPVVLLRVLNEQALKLRAGMPATVTIPASGQTYQAKVSAIGYSSVNADATSTMEVSLKETVVRLDLADKEVRAPLNSRVRVYIRTL